MEKESKVGKIDRIKELESQLADLRAEHEAEVASVRNALREERDQLVSQAQGLITKAESLTDQIGDSFGWDVAYGMGGFYDGREGEWTSSSENC